MWKIILLSAFLSACQAANINDLYGTFTSVVAYPHSKEPICAKYTFAEGPQPVQCTCSDGTKTTLVQIKFVERLEPSVQITTPITISGPILAVDKFEDLVRLTNVTCDCAGKEYDFRGVIKTVNENYILAYVSNGPRTADAGNQDYLLARNLPSAAELEAATTSLDDLKVRSGTVVCTKEKYEQLRPKN